MWMYEYVNMMLWMYVYGIRFYEDIVLWNHMSIALY
jgi:hypothetical protein